MRLSSAAPPRARDACDSARRGRISRPVRDSDTRTVPVHAGGAEVTADSMRLERLSPRASWRRTSGTVRRMWTDEVDDILSGDLVAALAYLTSAGGAVATPVCPLGLHDRDQGR